MKKAVEYSIQLLKILNNMEEDFEILSDKNSEIESMQQDILHKIESEKFNSVEGYYLAKKIKDIRIIRRGIKNEYEALLISLVYILYS